MFLFSQCENSVGELAEIDSKISYGRQPKLFIAARCYHDQTNLTYNTAHDFSARRRNREPLAENTDKNIMQIPLLPCLRSQPSRQQ